MGYLRPSQLLCNTFHLTIRNTMTSGCQYIVFIPVYAPLIATHVLYQAMPELASPVQPVIQCSQFSITFIMLPDFMIQHNHQFCEELIITFPFIKRSFIGILDSRHSILISYAEIFPKGSHQIIAYFFHKFFECHILIIIVVKELFKILFPIATWVFLY